MCRKPMTLAFVLAIVSMPIRGWAQSTVDIAVNADASKLPISPLIYGTAFADTAQLTDLNIGLNRMGGNDESCYNWSINASNKGQDWYFESIGDASTTAGERGDTFISQSKAAGAQAMVTIPMLGWVAKLGPDRGKLASFSIKKYGAQTGNDSEWFPDAGDGVSSATGKDITGNDPNDAQTPSSLSFEQGWISHIVSKWGLASKGGLHYYLMDNEPSIWFSTHRDVHPIGPTMEEIRNDILSYGAQVKADDPSAVIIGPEEWGWTGYFYSGYDQWYAAQHGWSNTHPDRAAHGNMDYIPWLLKQFKANSDSTGKRILDVLSVHCYPQGGEFSNDVSTATELLRNKSTRSLWDPNYVDESWIDSTVDLIPRLHGWVSTYYPGTKTAITEYNWGAEPYINGATTQADIFGIFGREGLDMATRWTTPDASTPTYKAIKMYRNYDGNKSTFGDTSVLDTVPDPDNVSSFAALRSTDRYLTVMVINKQLTAATSMKLSVSNFSGNGWAHVYQLTSANIITQLGDVKVASNVVSADLPAQSITLFVLPPTGVVPTAPPTPTGLTARAGNKAIALSWNASGGATTYNVLRSLVGTSGYVAVAHPPETSWTDTTVSNGTKYYYEVTATNQIGTSGPSNGVNATPINVPPDTAQYNFETGIQGWQAGGGVVTAVAQSGAEAFAGFDSMAVSIGGGSAGTNDAYVLSPSTPAGATITYHVWVPSGSGLASIQPYVLQGASGNWTWTGNWQPISSLKANAWNSLKVTVPSNAVVPLYSLGVEFATSTDWSGTCYVDSIGW